MEEDGTAVCQGWGPYCWELKSTVQIHGGPLLLIEDGFCSRPLPVVRDHSFHLGTFTINVVVTLLHMYSITIPVITSLYSLSVLRKSSLQVPLCLTNAYIPDRKLCRRRWQTTDLFFSCGILILLYMDQKLSNDIGWLEDSLDPKWCTKLIQILT